MITKKNYELYFIDYLEGKLSADNLESFTVFLKENPELKHELELITSSPVYLEKENKSIIDFSFLKKENKISIENEDDYFIGKIENQLTKDELKLLSLYLIEFPDKKDKLDSFERTILVSDNVICPNKEKLKKSKRIGAYYYWTAGVAASILILFAINLFLDVKTTPASVVTKIKINSHLPFSESKEKVVEIPQPKVEIARAVLVKKLEVKKEINVVTSADESFPELVTIKLDEVEQKKLEVIEDRSIAIKHTSPSIPEIISIEDVEVEKVKLDEYVKTSVKTFASEKTGEKIDKPKDLLAFASKKIKKITPPNFIKEEVQEDENNEVRTFRIGKIIKITRKKKK